VKFVKQLAQLLLFVHHARPVPREERRRAVGETAADRNYLLTGEWISAI
jgi:hypothetical protein